MLNIAEKFNNNENNVKNVKDDNTNTRKVPVVSMDTIALAHKIYRKFGDNAEAIKGVSKMIDMMVIQDNALVLEVPNGMPITFAGKDKHKENINALPVNNAPSMDEPRDWVNIFGANLNCDVLNKAIEIFEKQFNEHPYLIMSRTTLNVFEELTEKFTCANVDIDCTEIDCDDCPANINNDADEVLIEHDCEKGIMTAYYLHNDEEYTIVVDNDLGFGVVKVR